MAVYFNISMNKFQKGNILKLSTKLITCINNIKIIKVRNNQYDFIDLEYNKKYSQISNKYIHDNYQLSITDILKKL